MFCAQASCARLAHDASGKTFSHVFGTTSNALELLLLETKMKGPCWLDVKAPQPVSNPTSWCKLQADCPEPRSISVTPHPQVGGRQRCLALIVLAAIEDATCCTHPC